MKILFLDQSGELGGAEFALADLARPYRDSCLVGLFAEGTFRTYLEQQLTPVRVLTSQAIPVRKDSSMIQGFRSLLILSKLIFRVVHIAKGFDLIFANTQKALVVGAIASWLARRPLVYYLHDILSTEHFSRANLLLAVRLANRFASLVIANSNATLRAFIDAGGRDDIVEVVYNSFEPDPYRVTTAHSEQLKKQLGLDGKFVIGHFSRLSPWKGQHVLIEALKHCPEDVTAVFVGDALFGEEDYVRQLYQTVQTLSLEDRVRFLGFRNDIPQLMASCNLVAHTSTAPEPFGRVIVEGMLCGRPVVAAKAGGAMELVETGKTGWLCTPDDPQSLVEVILTCRNYPERAEDLARQAQAQACQRFDPSKIQRQIALLFDRVA
jgi:glycosyltransferase involved in cell wall biosynthesis